MKTFESVFPILMLYKKDEEYREDFSNLALEDIFSNGTGFFVSEDGLFMSVGHNFEQKSQMKETLNKLKMSI